MIKTITSDLLTCGADIICQQVNCMGVMGSGLALQIRNTYPLVYTKYKEFCASYATRSDALFGANLYVYLPGLIVVNMFAQRGYGRTGLHTDYNILCECLCKLRNFCNSHDLCSVKNPTIGIPYGIGCGLGGGDWHIVEGIIQTVFDGFPGQVLICKKGGK